MTIHHPSTAGLDGIAAAVTVLSHVDGEHGELVIAGSRVGDLAGSVGFEALAARLWADAGVWTGTADEASALIGQARVAAFQLLPALLPAARGMPIADGFRVAVAGLRPVDGIPDAATLVGAMPVIAAALVRIARGEAPVRPDSGLGHAADFLRMLTGAMPGDPEASALDAYLVTVSDHGMNASTFAARVVASTQADLFMAVTAAYCALTGPLHGGAPGPVLDMLHAIGNSRNIAPWIDAALERGERLMGFGHRIYKVRDPRADVLRRAVGTLGRSQADLGLAAEVEAYAREALARAKPEWRLDTNVEFYTAILLDALGIPRDTFTPVFAAGRTLGWTAHAVEQQRTGRLLRPGSIYAGPMPD